MLMYFIGAIGLIGGIFEYVGLFALYPSYKIMCELIEYKCVYWHWIPVGWKITKIMIYHSFSHKPITLPETLEHLVMDRCFNLPMVLPNNLLSLVMSDNFDQPIVLPNTLVYLKMGFQYNQPIVLPEFLECLKLGYKFDKIIKFPKSLRYLDIGSCYKHKSILPESLETIVFSCRVSNDLTIWYCDNLPNSVKKVIFENDICRKPLVNLPNLAKYSIENKNCWTSHRSITIF